MQPNFFKLNCFVLGDELNRIFPVDIAPTENVCAFRKMIKEEKKPQFDDIPADHLDLWKVDLPVNETLEHTLRSLTLDPKQRLFPLVELFEIFPELPKEEHLHIVIKRPGTSAAVVHLPINLNCYILYDDLDCIFQIKISQTDDVGVLKKLIQEMNRKVFRNVAAHRIVLWRVSLPLDNTLEHSLMNLTLDSKPTLSYRTMLSQVFSELPEEGHLHIVVQRPSTIPLAPNSPPLERRIAYFNMDIGYPQLKKVYFRDTVCDALPPVPVTLFDRILAGFVDDCQNRRPTADDDSFVWRLSEMMHYYYSDDWQMSTFKELLSDYGIKLDASTTECTTDGHLLSSQLNIVIAVSKGKSEIGGGGAEQFVQALSYYHKLIHGRRHGILKLRTLFPCLNIIFFGACIGIAGSVVTDQVQADILVPIIPLFCHSTDRPMQAMAARTFGALKIAINKLEELYSQPIPLLEPDDSFLECPYPLSYTDWTDHTHAFSYDVTQPLKERLIFFGETGNGAARRKICIKFVRHYSPVAHKFCASKGHAPELIAYNPLLGGWNMVIMNFLDIDRICYPQPRPGSYQPLDGMVISERQPLEGNIISLVKELHNHEGGYVHGDLRDINFFVRDDGEHFMLLDFDWAGPIHMTRYPMYLNQHDVRRPEGARDWEEITVRHDLDMLKYIFHPELDDLEENTQEGPTAKRPRLSS